MALSHPAWAPLQQASKRREQDSCQELVGHTAIFSAPAAVLVLYLPVVYHRGGLRAAVSELTAENDMLGRGEGERKGIGRPTPDKTPMHERRRSLI